MQSFTIRPDTEWSVSETSYQMGTYKQIFNVTINRSQGLTADHFEGDGITAVGGTSDFVEGTVTNRLFETNRGRQGATYIHIQDDTASATQVHNFDPSTASEHIPADGTNESSDVTHTFDYTAGFTRNNFLTEREEWVFSDTFFSVTRGTSANWIEVSEGPSGAYETAKTDPTVTDETDITATTHTFNGASTKYTTEDQTAYYKDFTATFTDGEINVFTISTFTLSTTHTSMPSSSWQTGYSLLTGQETTRLDYNEDSSNAVTYNADITDFYTSLDGTSTVNETSFVHTGHWFTDLKDTVVLMNANRGKDFKRGGKLWVFDMLDLPETGSTTGRFSDIYSSRGGETITIEDFRKWLTESIAESGITLSVGTTTSENSDGASFTFTVTSSNGSWFPNQTLTSTDSTGGSHTYTAAPILTTADSRTFDLHGVESTLHTYYSESEHTDPAVSETIFTHTAYTSSYRQSDSSWITGTTTSTWVSDTVSSFARNVLHSPATTTHVVSYRGTTADTILVSLFSVTGSITSTITDEHGGTTGVGTNAVFLGMAEKTSSRVLTLERTETISTYMEKFHRYLSQYTSEASEGTTLNYEGTDPGQPFTQVDNGGTTRIYADELNMTQYSQFHLGPEIYKKPKNYNENVVNEARFRCYPNGFAGFGGSFNNGALAVHRTTTEGLHRGQTFSSDQHVFLGGFVSIADGVSMIPIFKGMDIYGGFESASIISIPKGIESIISIAATWTSTTKTGRASSDTAVTSRFATHTIKLKDSISGEFWKVEPMTVDNGYQDEFDVAGVFAGSCGHGVGENFMRSSYRVILDAGYVEWTEYSGQKSTGGITKSASGSNGSVSFSVPWSHAIVFRAENLLTVKWEKGEDDFNFFFSYEYQDSPS